VKMVVNDSCVDGVSRSSLERRCLVASANESKDRVSNAWEASDR
jgi:hypothetical protein